MNPNDVRRLELQRIAFTLTAYVQHAPEEFTPDERGALNNALTGGLPRRLVREVAAVFTATRHKGHPGYDDIRDALATFDAITAHEPPEQATILPGWVDRYAAALADLDVHDEELRGGQG